MKTSQLILLIISSVILLLFVIKGPITIPVWHCPDAHIESSDTIVDATEHYKGISLRDAGVVDHVNMACRIPWLVRSVFNEQSIAFPYISFTQLASRAPPA